MHVPTLCDWFTSSASACDNDHPVFHLIVKFYASDYDSDPDCDSVASENQPYSHRLFNSQNYNSKTHSAF